MSEEHILKTRRNLSSLTL